MSERLSLYGLSPAHILLPRAGVDLSKWAVVACDQYTSEPEYWKSVEEIVGAAPSTLRMIYPEVYLGKEDDTARIAHIHSAMRAYCDNVLENAVHGFVYVERFCGESVRRGLIAAVDLDAYDYAPGSVSLIRATEGTILERIPPRMRVRENAPLELPHILMLIDDPDGTIIEPIAARKSTLRTLYDTALMKGGGRVVGWAVEAGDASEQIADALENLAGPERMRGKYGVCSDTAPLLFAVGDGNHSLATARACWLRIKLSLNVEDAASHPARYALVELMNVHDQGLSFEPIHRALFGVDPSDFISAIAARFPHQKGSPLVARVLSGKDELDISSAVNGLPLCELQPFLDAYVAAHQGSSMDYIHGEDVVRSLASGARTVGLLLPPMDKHELFRTVIREGTLPRKTFSMGEAHEKRYYMECRRILRDAPNT